MNGPKCSECLGSGIESGSINAADDGNDCWKCRGTGREPETDREKVLAILQGRTNLGISGDLDSLSLKMRSVGAKMEMHPDAEVKKHGIEMLGASELARQWAKRMRVLK